MTKKAVLFGTLFHTCTFLIASGVVSHLQGGALCRLFISSPATVYWFGTRWFSAGM